MFPVSSPSSSSSSSSPASSMASTTSFSPTLSPQKPPPYACDTLPAPQNLRFSRGFRHTSRSPSPFPSPTADDDTPTSTFYVPIVEDNQIVKEPEPLASSSAFKADELEQALPQPPARKLCVRHQRMADQGTSLHLQKSLDALPLEDRESVNTIWSTFSSSSHPRRAMILQGLLTMCCFSQLSLLTEQLTNLIRLDPFTVLPREISLKILGHLDATSLCRAAQVNRHWRALADDDILWRSICEQHIGQKCHKCGWGLPMLERRRKMRIPLSPPPSESLFVAKRDLEDLAAEPRPLKRQRSEGLEIPMAHLGALSVHSSSSATSLRSRSMTPSLYARPISPPASSSSFQSPSTRTITRPWKDVYSERLTIERNWRRGRCTVQTLKGHTDGVMCMQFSETLQHPSFPVLITGSYDRTARVWNLEKGQEVQCLRGHSRAIRALQFDAAKLITGSMDHTLRVWNWRTGRCVRTLEGHSDGVVSLNFDSNVLASGSVDSSIKIWNFRTGECFTLRGHRDWVNSVQLWDSRPDAVVESANATLDAALISGATETSSLPTLDPGKMLFSASDDGTIRLWDLTLRTCIRQFTGHMGQVQSIKLLKLDPSCDDDSSPSQDDISSSPITSTNAPPHPSSSTIPVYPSFSNSVPSPPLPGDESTITPSCIVDVPPSSATHSSYSPPVSSDAIYGPPNKKNPSAVLISGSLDNTIRVWDIETGKAVTTMFGHIEGVWAVASDKLRLVSGSHDRTIKVWSREEGRCTATLVGHRGAVTCLALGDDKIVSGSDDGDVRIWNFSC